MHSVCIWPETATPGLTEKRAGFGIYALALATGCQREEENEQNGKGEFPDSTERLCGKFDRGRKRAVSN